MLAAFEALLPWAGSVSAPLIGRKYRLVPFSPSDLISSRNDFDTMLAATEEKVPLTLPTTDLDDSNVVDDAAAAAVTEATAPASAAVEFGISGGNGGAGSDIFC